MKRLIYLVTLLMLLCGGCTRAKWLEEELARPINQAEASKAVQIAGQDTNCYIKLFEQLKPQRYKVQFSNDNNPIVFDIIARDELHKYEDTYVITEVTLHHGYINIGLTYVTKRGEYVYSTYNFYYSDYIINENHQIKYNTTNKWPIDFADLEQKDFGATLIASIYDGTTCLMHFDGPVTRIAPHAFENCSTLSGITIPNSVTEIGEYAFSGCSSLPRVEIPNSVTNIYNGAFAGCKKIVSMVLPYSTTTIRERLCYGCSALVSITIPENVTTIHDRAFEGCSALERVYLSEHLSTISDYAFYGCSSIVSIYIPATTTQINSFAFNNCTSLESVYCEATTPPSLEWNAFDYNAEDRKFYVPNESVEAYKSDYSWQNYSSSIVGHNF